jgi:ABC-type transport system involved in cytochrome c biogenesis ATPase subunit
LLNIVGGLDEPGRGHVTLDGHDVVAMSEEELARLRLERIGFVFQTFNLLNNFTALENVEAPIVLLKRLGKRERRERALDLLASVGLSDRVDHFPSELSGGQQQRVAIARALANDPTIVIGDEMTGDLDSETGFEIMRLVRDLNQREGKTVDLRHPRPAHGEPSPTTAFTSSTAGSSRASGRPGAHAHDDAVTFTYVLRNLRRRKVRSVLMILALVVGVGALVALNATVDSYRRFYAGTVSGEVGGFDLVVTHRPDTAEERMVRPERSLPIGAGVPDGVAVAAPHPRDRLGRLGAERGRQALRGARSRERHVRRAGVTEGQYDLSLGPDGLPGARCPAGHGRRAGRRRGRHDRDPVRRTGAACRRASRRPRTRRSARPRRRGSCAASARSVVVTGQEGNEGVVVELGRGPGAVRTSRARPSDCWSTSIARSTTRRTRRTRPSRRGRWRTTSARRWAPSYST